VGVGVQGAYVLGGAHAQSQRRMHRHTDADEPGASRRRAREGIDGQIDGRDGHARPPQHGRRPGQAQRLVAQFVAGQE